jgi:hypothetical protein
MTPFFVTQEHREGLKIRFPVFITEIAIDQCPFFLQKGTQSKIPIFKWGKSN